MDFSPDADREEIRSAVRDLCAGFGGDYWRELDRKREYPERFVRALTEAGWLGALIPTEYGGSGLGVADAASMARGSFDGIGSAAKTAVAVSPKTAITMQARNGRGMRATPQSKRTVGELSRRDCYLG